MEGENQDSGEFFSGLAAELGAHVVAQDALHKAQFPELHTTGWEAARRREQIEEVNFRLGWIVPAIAQRRVLDSAWYAGFVQAVVERRDPPLYGQYLRSINEVPDTKEEKLAFWNTTAPLEALGRVAQMLDTPKQEVGRLLYPQSVCRESLIRKGITRLTFGQTLSLLQHGPRARDA